MAGVEFIDEGVKWRVHNIEFDAEHEEPVCFYYDVRINRVATKHDCQYSGSARAPGAVPDGDPYR